MEDKTGNLRARPAVRLIGEDGNIYNLVGIVMRVLKEVHGEAYAEQFKEEVFSQHSYEDALVVIMTYCEVE